MSVYDESGSRPSSSGSIRSAIHRTRRGGYKDAGGVAVGGVLEVAEPVSIHSERELQKEIETIAINLNPKIDWQKRIEALNRLESLVAGGAANWQNFADLLRSQLRDVLSLQISDRRSAVSRQVCRLLQVMAAEIGSGFITMAVHFIDDLLKVLVITVQVMYEAADGAVRALLKHCRAHLLLKQLTVPIINDRSAKLRLCCATYLLQVLETWQPTEWRRIGDSVIKAVVAACGDASSETRALGRSCYMVLTASTPTAAAAVLDALPPAVRSQLSSGSQMSSAARGDSPSRISSSSGGAPAGRGDTMSRRAAPPPQHTYSVSESGAPTRSSIRSQPHTAGAQRSAHPGGQPPRPPPYAPPSEPLHSHSASFSGAAAATTPGARPMRQLHHAGRRATTSAVGLGNRRRSAIPLPQRVPNHVDDSQLDKPGRSISGDVYKTASEDGRFSPRDPKRRSTVAAVQQRPGATDSPPPPRAFGRSWNFAPTGGQPWSDDNQMDDVPSVSSVDGGVNQEAVPSPTVDSLVAVIADGNRSRWHSRASAYEGLRLLMWQDGDKSAPLLARRAPQLLPHLVIDLGSVHSRVAAASAGTLSAAAVGCGAALEEHLIPILHPLLHAAADIQRPDVAKSANRALQDIAESVEALAVLRALTATFDGNISEAVRLQTLTFFTQHLVRCLPPPPAFDEEGQTAEGAAEVANWVRSVKLCANSAIAEDIRQAASSAAEAAQPWLQPELGWTMSTVLERPLSNLIITDVDPLVVAQMHSRAGYNQPQVISPVMTVDATSAVTDGLAHMRVSAEVLPSSHPLPPESPTAAEEHLHPVVSAGMRSEVQAQSLATSPQQQRLTGTQYSFLSASSPAEGTNLHAVRMVDNATFRADPTDQSSNLSSDTPWLPAGSDPAALSRAAASRQQGAIGVTGPFESAEQVIGSNTAPQYSNTPPRHANHGAHSTPCQTVSLQEDCAARVASAAHVIGHFDPYSTSSASLASAVAPGPQLPHPEQQQQGDKQVIWGQQAKGEEDSWHQLAKLPVSPPPWEQPANVTPTGSAAAFLKADVLSGIATATTPLAHYDSRQYPSREAPDDVLPLHNNHLHPQQQQQQQQQQQRQQQDQQPDSLQEHPHQHQQAIRQTGRQDNPALEQPDDMSNTLAASTGQSRVLSPSDGSLRRVRGTPGRGTAVRVKHLLDSDLTHTDIQAAARDEVSAAAAKEPLMVLSVVQHHILSDDCADVSTILVSIAGTSAAAAALSDGDLLEACQQGEVLQGLFAALGHSASEVRKGTILALVEISTRLGDEGPRLLAPLSPAQAKLLSIYVTKAVAKRKMAQRP